MGLNSSVRDSFRSQQYAEGKLTWNWIFLNIFSPIVILCHHPFQTYFLSKITWLDSGDDSLLSPSEYFYVFIMRISFTSFTFYCRMTQFKPTTNMWKYFFFSSCIVNPNIIFIYYNLTQYTFYKVTQNKNVLKSKLKHKPFLEVCNYLKNCVYINLELKDPENAFCLKCNLLKK